MPRRRAAFAALFALTLIACRDASGPILRDDGGNLLAYAAEARRLNQRGETKVIAGDCFSACTLFLSVRRACVTKSARLWFHAPHTPGDLTPDALGGLQMLSYYPQKVRDWAIRVHALESAAFTPEKSLSGDELIAMGVAACGAGS
jgi:hypothetical protein